MAHLDWMYAAAHMKNAPKRPPNPLPRPTDPQRPAALSLAELDKVIEIQTGAPRGIEEVA